jgi:hypothetical protein
MKTLLTSAYVVSATLGLALGLLWLDPFEKASDGLGWAFGAAPKWKEVHNFNRDPLLQEGTHGEKPLPELSKLAAHWGSHPQSPRVVLMGNSQTFSMSLAPDEAPSPCVEHTYSDLISTRLASRGVFFYRLAAAGLSYSEALWYLEYLIAVPALRPSALLLQVNYQAFWNGGIRDSLLSLLDDPTFRARMEARARSGRPYADNFAEALKRDAEIRARSAAQSGNGEASRAWQTGFGPALEDGVRHEMEPYSLYNVRGKVKESFTRLLYESRQYFLRIKPSNARSLSGPRLTRSQAALDEIAVVCREAHVRLMLFTAPVNPLVSLYASAQDKASFDGFIRELVERHQSPITYLENAIPAKLWGQMLNSPDPLHIGRKGHEIMADLLLPVVESAMRMAPGGAI